MVLPGEAEKGAVKVFGHPASVSGKTSLSPDKISPRLVASDVPPGQFVEMRVVFPRELLTSTSGAKVEPGEGLKEIMAKGVLSYDPVNLTDFEKRMREGDEHSRRSYNSSYQGFRNALKREVERRDLVERGPGVWLGWVTLLLGLAGTEWFVFSLLGASVEAVIILIGSSLFVFGIVVAIVWRVFGYAGLALGSVLHPLWVRRTPKGALLHARWQAFRRYLSDFSPPSSSGSSSSSGSWSGGGGGSFSGGGGGGGGGAW